MRVFLLLTRLEPWARRLLVTFLGCFAAMTLVFGYADLFETACKSAICAVFWVGVLYGIQR